MAAILELKQISVAFGGVAALSRVDLAVEEGELLALIGPNGSGKTTLLNAVSGQVRLAAGEIWYAGRRIDHLPAYQRSRLGIGRAFQQVNLFPGLSVAENLRLPVEARLGLGWRLWRGADRYPEVNRAVDGLVHEFGLDEKAGVAVGSLAHGEKRVLDVAMALALRPRLLLLDEPTAGMAVEEVPHIAGLIRQVHAKTGITIVVIEHRIDVVKALADRIVVLHDGHVLATGTPAAIMADKKVQEVYLGGLYAERD